MARSDNRSGKIPHVWILDVALVWAALVICFAIVLWLNHETPADIVRQVAALLR